MSWSSTFKPWNSENEPLLNAHITVTKYLACIVMSCLHRKRCDEEKVSEMRQKLISLPDS